MSERISRIVAAVFSAWWAYVTSDFVIHAVLLESWWQGTAAFWLPPVELAKRLPFAYAGFALYCACLCWVMVRIRIGAPGVAHGLVVGAAGGAAFGVVAALGIYSVVRMPLSFLLVGPASTTISSTLAGGAAAWVSDDVRRWRRAGIVLTVGIGAFVAGAVVQNMLRGNH